MINLYNSKETNFNNNGIGSLKDTIKCEVTEELNGEYVADLEYPKNHKYSKYLDNDMIVKIDVGNNEKQLFRIKNYKENLFTITSNLQHITYDLVDNALDDTFPQKMTGAAAIDWIFNHTQYGHKFKAFSDITKIASARYVRKNVIEALIGNIDNSFASVWGGEIERDNFTVKMLKRRGQDNGYKIKYRKNITGLQFLKEDTNIITRLRPIGFDGLMLPEKYVDSTLIGEYPHPKIRTS